MAIATKTASVLAMAAMMEAPRLDLVANSAGWASAGDGGPLAAMEDPVGVSAEAAAAGGGGGEFGEFGFGGGDGDGDGVGVEDDDGDELSVTRDIGDDDDIAIGNAEKAPDEAL